MERIAANQCSLTPGPDPQYDALAGAARVSRDFFKAILLSYEGFDGEQPLQALKIRRILLHLPVAEYFVLGRV